MAENQIEKESLKINFIPISNTHTHTYRLNASEVKVKWGSVKKWPGKSIQCDNHPGILLKRIGKWYFQWQLYKLNGKINTLLQNWRLNGDGDGDEEWHKKRIDNNIKWQRRNKIHLFLNFVYLLIEWRGKNEKCNIPSGRYTQFPFFLLSIIFHFASCLVFFHSFSFATEIEYRYKHFGISTIWRIDCLTRVFFPLSFCLLFAPHLYRLKAVKIWNIYDAIRKSFTLNEQKLYDFFLYW